MRHGDFLELPRCPHCQTARSTLAREADFHTFDHKGQNMKRWCVYVCRVCGGATLAVAQVDDVQGMKFEQEIVQTYPGRSVINAAVPNEVRRYLTQAHECLNSPDGAVMLTASAVDAMLKEKKYRAGSLYSRIDKAAKDGVITKDMATWAHQVRLDANDPRHADENAPPHDTKSASRVVEFANALAEFHIRVASASHKGRERLDSEIAQNQQTSRFQIDPQSPSPPVAFRYQHTV